MASNFASVKWGAEERGLDQIFSEDLSSCKSIF